MVETPDNVVSQESTTALSGLVASASVQMPLRLGDYEVRLAENWQEIEAAQALRYETFYLENGAVASPEQLKLQRDIDIFDEHSEHLLVFYLDNGTAEPVGTYRMMRSEGAAKVGRFLSSEEYDLSLLFKRQEKILELSRACITPEHRQTSVMQLLWQGLTSYILHNDIKYMFGCASFHGVQVAPFAEVLSYLYHNHLAPEDIRPVALKNRYVDMRIIEVDKISKIKALKEIPHLMKSYLRLGGWVGDGAVIDPIVRTVDTCIVVDVANIDQRYYKHYTRKFKS